jgi:hypothetical protein
MNAEREVEVKLQAPLTLALDWMGGQFHASAAYILRKIGFQRHND